MTKDYYKILGVAEFDTAENIKTAYRKLARKWHPDIAGSSKEAIFKFKEINEAYEILSNKIKKEEYDRARRFYSYANKKFEESNNQFKNTQFDKKTSTSEKKSFSFNWEEFLSKKRRETSFKHEEKNAPKRGENIYSDIEISIFEANSGTTKTLNMLQTKICPKCNGRKFINGSICPNCKGKGELNQYKKFNVKIPADIKNGSKIRLAGEGSDGINGGKNGDLYITVHIKQPQNYKIDGLNILKTVPVTPYEAVLGGEIKITSLKGQLSVKLLPNTQNGQKIRLSGCGIVQNDAIGDMIITVEIRIPENITQEEINLYKQLESISSHNLRDNFYDR